MLLTAMVFTLTKTKTTMALETTTTAGIQGEKKQVSGATLLMLTRSGNCVMFLFAKVKSMLS